MKKATPCETYIALGSSTVTNMDRTISWCSTLSINILTTNIGITDIIIIKTELSNFWVIPTIFSKNNIEQKINNKINIYISKEMILWQCIHLTVLWPFLTQYPHTNSPDLPLHISFKHSWENLLKDLKYFPLGPVVRRQIST